MENLIIKEMINSNIAVATEAGNKVFNELLVGFDKGEKINLDFEGISIVSTAFLNAAIGQLYSEGRYTSDFLNKSLKLINIQPEDEPLFIMVVHRAKEYFADKSKFEDHTRDVFNNH